MRTLIDELNLRLLLHLSEQTDELTELPKLLRSLLQVLLAQGAVLVIDVVAAALQLL